jgi:putative holliday junction resolvase
MGRILAIDYGSKRVGLAVTDPLQIIATALDTVHSKDVIAYLKAYEAREGIEAFVVGMPKRLDNTDTNATALVQAFVKNLQKNFPSIPLHLHDERFTSAMALQTMIAGGMKKKDRREKANVDKISATIILQSFLEQKK